MCYPWNSSLVRTVLVAPQKMGILPIEPSLVRTIKFFTCKNRFSSSTKYRHLPIQPAPTSFCSRSWPRLSFPLLQLRGKEKTQWMQKYLCGWYSAFLQLYDSTSECTYINPVSKCEIFRNLPLIEQIISQTLAKNKNTICPFKLFLKFQT